MVVSSVPPMISAIWSARSLCSTLTMSAPSSIVMLRPDVEHRVDVLEERVGVLALDRVGVDARRSTSAAATSSWVDSGFEAHSATSAPAGLQRHHQVGGLGRHVQARADADARRAAAPSRTAPGSAPAPASPRRPTRCAPGRPARAPCPVRRSSSSDPSPHSHRHIRGSRSTSSRPTATAVSFETRTTSSCSTCSPKAFVSEHRPSTRMPSARAGSASGHHRHPHHRGARLLQQPHLGGRLVGRSAHRRVDARRRRDARARRRARAPGRADRRRRRLVVLMNAGIPSGSSPPAQRGRPHQVEVVAQHHDRARGESGHDAAHRRRHHHRVGAELRGESRQQRGDVHPVAFVEVHPAEERRDRHAGQIRPSTSRPAWPGTPGAGTRAGR